MNGVLFLNVHRRRMVARSCLWLLSAVVLLGVAAHRTSAQEFDSSQDLSIGDSEYDTTPSVADDLDRDLSAGDDEYDTPLAPDPPVIRPSFPSSGQMRFDGSEVVAPPAGNWPISRGNVIAAVAWGVAGALLYSFLWLFVEATT